MRPITLPGDVGDLLGDHRFSALLIGPGAGTGEETRARELAILRTGRSTVLDADALTAFQDDPPALARASDRGDKLTRTHAAARRGAASWS